MLSVARATLSLSKGPEGESKHPDTFSRAMLRQGVLSRPFHFPLEIRDLPLAQHEKRFCPGQGRNNL
jgi:hypothetical protein